MAIDIDSRSILHIEHHHQFLFRKHLVGSIYNLLESLTYENPNHQLKTMRSTTTLKESGTWKKDGVVYWQGEQIPRQSAEYQNLLSELFQVYYTDVTPAQKELIATGDEPLKWSKGKKDISETLLTQQEFITRLTTIRTELKSKINTDTQGGKKSKNKK